MASSEPPLPDAPDGVGSDPGSSASASATVVDAPSIDEIPPSRTGGEPEVASPLTRRERRRRKREAKWTRQRPPKDWRFWVGGLGRVLIVIGVLMFGFVAYQLWGTAIETARAQRALENDFEEALAQVEPVAEAAAEPVVEQPPADETDPPPTDPPDSEGVGEGVGEGAAAAPVPVAQQNIPFVEDGDAIARLEIPRLGVNDIVVAGVDTNDLKKGPGHYPDTPMPGQLGNAAIAGHRTTYGQPFHDVDDLEPGDEIIVTTLSGRFVYRVTGQAIVEPSDYEVVATTDPTVSNLTLTSCHPKWTAQDRIVIFSQLDAEASGPVGEPVLNYGRAADVGADDPAPVTEGDGSLPTIDDPVIDVPAQPGEPADSTAGATSDIVAAQAAGAGIASAFSEGWFSDPGALVDVFLWAALLIVIAALGYLVARSLRRSWAGVLVVCLPFLVALYFFYQNVNRLLPPNL